jgi:hypothetical protein
MLDTDGDKMTIKTTQLQILIATFDTEQTNTILLAPDVDKQIRVMDLEITTGSGSNSYLEFENSGSITPTIMVPSIADLPPNTTVGAPIRKIGDVNEKLLISCPAGTSLSMTYTLE